MTKPKRTCVIGGCASTAVARAMCQFHYDRWRHGRSLESPKMNKGRAPQLKQPCSQDSCSALVVARGLCRKHYSRWYNSEGRPGYNRKLRLLRKFGLTSIDVEMMIVNQGGGCAICGSTDWGFHGPHVDHCHVTEVVRGILCLGCNVGIGNFQENPERLRAAADWLENLAQRKQHVAL